VGGVHFELTLGAHSHDLSDSEYSWLDPQGVGFLGGGGAAADDGGWHLVSMLLNSFFFAADTEEKYVGASVLGEFFKVCQMFASEARA
jgi:hypothetical protein